MRTIIGSPDQPDVIELIAELDAYQDSLYPAESRYALDLDSLKKSWRESIPRTEQRYALILGQDISNK